MRKKVSRTASEAATFAPPAGADAALFFADGECHFQALRDGRLVVKTVSAAAVRQAFAGEPVDSGWLPPNVHRCGQNGRGVWMLRWHAPARYPVVLDEGREKRRLLVPMPALVWFGCGNAYYVWAAAGDVLNPKAHLFRAPLPNVNHVGLVCFGKNPHPDVRKGGFDVSWRTFWDAPFNDHQDDGKSRKHPQSVLPMLAELAGRRSREYPAGDLMAMNITLDGMVEQMTRREAE
jgi:PRTRC genetic system protein B